MRSMRIRICSSSSKSLPMACSVPACSKYVNMHPLTIISVTVSSSMRGWSGPSPTTSSKTSTTTSSRSSWLSSPVSRALITASTAGRSSSRECLVSESRAKRATSANPTRSSMSRFASRTMARRERDALPRGAWPRPPESSWSLLFLTRSNRSKTLTRPHRASSKATAGEAAQKPPGRRLAHRHLSSNQAHAASCG